MCERIAKIPHPLRASYCASGLRPCRPTMLPSLGLCAYFRIHKYFSHSIEFLRNNRLRVDTPLPLRLCLCFGMQSHPMPDEEERRRLPADYAARSTVTV